MPDRYADAVRARRAELRARRARLTGGHREELRSAVALSRLAASAEIAAALAELAAEAAAHLERADRAARRQFPVRLGHAVDDTARRLHDRWAGALRPALLRIAGARSLPVRPRLPAPRPLPTAGLPAPGSPAPLRRLRVLATGAVRGAAMWRIVLVPLVLLPVWGLPALGGRPLAPVAAGVGAATIVGAARARSVGAERARLRRHADEGLAAARGALVADLGRRLIEVEAAAAATLDAAAGRRRAEIDAELRLLAPTAEPERDGRDD